LRSVYTTEYHAFLRRLRAARKEAGLSQVDVAKAMRRPQSWVSRCESGERRVDVIELQSFARLYKRPILYFVPD
jgi:transcriptional regulator with XRE-family HTH domain